MCVVELTQCRLACILLGEYEQLMALANILDRENNMNKDQIRDRFQANKGKIKVAAGMLFDDGEMEHKVKHHKHAGKLATNFSDLKYHLKDIKEDM
jgi:uncharacterized protein YjbJ (UPF0337 family)